MKTDAGMGKHGDGGEKTVIICASPLRVTASLRPRVFHPSSVRPLSVSPRRSVPASFILHPSSFICASPLRVSVAPSPRLSSFIPHPSSLVGLCF